MRVNLTWTHNARVNRAYLLTYMCKSCGHRQLARVHSKGEGNRSTLLFFGLSAAKAKAAQDAAWDANQNAWQLLNAARCPKCTAIDNDARSKLRTGMLANGLGIAAVAGFSLALKLDPVLVLVLSVGLLAFTQAKGSWKVSEVDQRVVFLGDAELAALAQWRVAPLWRNTEGLVSWPLCDEVHLGLVSVEPDGIHWLEPADLNELDPESVKVRAVENLAAASTAPIVEVARGVFRGQWGDGLAAARLALPDLVESLPIDGPLVAFTATEDSFLIANEYDHEAIRAALSFAAKDVEALGSNSTVDAFTSKPWILMEEGWKRWTEVPEAIAGSSEARRLQAVLAARLGAT